jgi:Arc/MetJ family transcription regulator
MHTTLNLDDDLIQRAAQATGVKQKTALVHLGLEALIERASRERLIALGGTDPTAAAPPRRRAPRNQRP